MSKQFDEYAKKNFDNELGITAKVNRFEEQGPFVLRANRGLNDIGTFIQGETEALQQLEYKGSMAVHVYAAPIIGQMIFVEQVNTMLTDDERFIGPAITALQKAAMRSVGRDPGKIRSGF